MAEATMYIGKRQRLELLKKQLEDERSSFLPHWRECADYNKPRRPRFVLSDVNKGDRRSQKIIDGTPTRALRTLTAGMMGGITSPARPWFRLGVPDQGLNNYEPVKEWLHDVTTRMTSVFLRSNLYKVLPSTYSDLGMVATGCQFLEEDFETTIHNFSIPIGSYCIGNDSKLRVKIFTREFRMTVRQLIETFGDVDARTGKVRNMDLFSTMVQRQYETGNMEVWIDVCHIIEPNPDYRPNNPLPKYKKFSSYYYEKGTGAGYGAASSNDSQKFLRESGYDLFPVLAPRWEVTGEDVWGNSCPAMDALGDNKALQLMQRRKAQAMEKFVNPALQGPASLANQRVSQLPGDVTYVQEVGNSQGLRPIHEVDPRIQEILLDIQDTRQSISRYYFEDLFLMLMQTDRRQITATEIAERKEEKLLVLGPVLEQLNQDLLDPLIDNTFYYMMKQGQLPEAPEELQGQSLKVEYVSVMAQAQKLIGIGTQERFLGGIINMAQAFPSVIYKIDAFQMVDDLGDTLGVNPKAIRTNEEAAASQQQAMEAAQAQQQAETINQAAQAGKALGETPMDTDSALSRLLG
jgi:hypothetical protein